MGAGAQQTVGHQLVAVFDVLGDGVGEDFPRDAGPPVALMGGAGDTSDGYRGAAVVAVVAWLAAAGLMTVHRAAAIERQAQHLGCSDRIIA
ncbi:hypothetical protein [Mycobacterium sp. URHB0021]